MNKIYHFCFSLPKIEMFYYLWYFIVTFFSFFSFFTKFYSCNAKTCNAKTKKTLLLGGGGSKFWYLAGKLYSNTKENPEYIQGFDTIVGISAGSLIGAFAVSGCDLEKIKDGVIEITNQTLEKLFSIFHVLDIVKDFTRKQLPENAYQLCTNKLHIQTIHLYTGKVICFHTFSSNDDLVDKLMKACHVPFLCNSITNEGYIDRIFDVGKHGCCHSLNVEKIQVDEQWDVLNMIQIPSQKTIKNQFQKGYQKGKEKTT
jgi:hypothetical protein